LLLTPFEIDVPTTIHPSSKLVADQVEWGVELIQKVERLMFDTYTNETKKPEIATIIINTNIGTIKEQCSVPFSASPEKSTLRVPSIKGKWRSSPTPQPPGRKGTEVQRS